MISNILSRRKRRYILLYSDEYKAYFVADHSIIAERTSDIVEDYWANHPDKVKPKDK